MRFPEGDQSLNDLMSRFWPVGSIYTRNDNVNPADLFGGVWVPYGAGRVGVGLDAADPDFDTVGETGGAKTHTLTIAEMPSHTHVENSNNTTTGSLRGWGAPDTSTNQSTATGYLTGATGGGEAHNNMPPFIVERRWLRTA